LSALLLQDRGATRNRACDMPPWVASPAVPSRRYGPGRVPTDQRNTFLSQPPPIIEARALSKRFRKSLDLAGRIAAKLGADMREEVVHAVDSVSLAIMKGEVVGLVGESGCGKSTLGRMIAGLLEPSDGDVLFKGQNRRDLDGDSAKAARLAVQMIFQDPYASLNPRARVEDIVGEAPLVHGLTTRKDRAAYVAETLQRVGLDPGFVRRYPHQFSGGQRSRIGIARALAVKPEFLVCDEAIAALDVSIQAQVINLFMDLREQLDLTYLFISHDLGVVQHISDRVVIMYLGRVVESARTEDLFAGPNHPYAQALLAEVPRLTVGRRTFHPVKGEIPSPLDPPPGCHFHPRCPHAMPRCREAAPPLKEIAPGRHSACWLNDA
jgi:peptide/nickel transport system ATP-binding protein